jgi:hypothetical protein
MFGLLGRAFRTKVGIAVIGVLVVGGIGAAALARPAVPSHVALATTGGSQTTTSSSTLATSEATATQDQSAPPGTAPTTGAGAPQDTTPDGRPAAPTATPRPRPSGSPTATPLSSPTPRPTPTPPPVGKTVTLHGGVANVNGTTSFVLSVSGQPYTCTVSGSTSWPNLAVPNIGSLRRGMSADVTGALQLDGTFAATIVDAQPGDN